MLACACAQLVACNALLDNRERPLASTGEEGGVAADATARDVADASRDERELVPVPVEPVEIRAVGPERGLDVRYRVPVGTFFVQCETGGATQGVWQSTKQGTDADARFAEFKYPQESEVKVTCLGDGAPDATGHYPFVVDSAISLPDGVSIFKCLPGAQAEVYDIGGVRVNDRPTARYVGNEAHPACPP